jgi:Mrp family chromosome partitioning ATPase
MQASFGAQDHRPAESGWDAYRGAIRRQWLVLAAVLLLTVSTSVAWLRVKSPEYKVTAQILVQPLAQPDLTFVGVDLVRETSDPVRTIETAVTLIQNPAAAAATAERLGPGWSGKDVEESIVVQPHGQSNVIDVSASSDSPAVATRLANLYAKQSLDLRRAVIAKQAGDRLTAVRRQLSGLPADSRAADDMQAQVPLLEAVRAGQDPTVQLSQAALRPEKPSGPSRVLVLILAVFGGFALGVFAAVAADGHGRRGATTEELLWAYPRPVLARILRLRPQLLGGRRFSPLSPPPQAVEAYRSLLAQLERGAHGSVLVTSASQNDGKTSVAIGLAHMAASSGYRVALLDFDLRRPAIGQLLEVPHEERTPLGALRSKASVADLLIEHPGLEGLRVLALREQAGGESLETALRSLPDLLAAATREADIVIMDAPPLGEVSDALRVATDVDDIVVVVRPGHTNLTAFRNMRDLLERSQSPATGFVVIGDLEYESNYLTTVSAEVAPPRVRAG